MTAGPAFSPANIGMRRLPASMGRVRSFVICGICRRTIVTCDNGLSTIVEVSIDIKIVDTCQSDQLLQAFISLAELLSAPRLRSHLGHRAVFCSLSSISSAMSRLQLLTQMDDISKLTAIARAKLEVECDQREHSLRRMVLTANMLDGTLSPRSFFHRVAGSSYVDLMEEMHALRLKLNDPALAGQSIRWADRVASDLAWIEREKNSNGDEGESDDDDDDLSDGDSDCSSDGDEGVTPPPLKDDVMPQGNVYLDEPGSEDDDLFHGDLEDIVELTLTRCLTRTMPVEGDAVIKTTTVPWLSALPHAADRSPISIA